MLIRRTDRRYTKAAAMRVYVPSTLPALQEAYGSGELVPAGAGPAVAYAVTPGLREWYVSDDAEELEYAALRGAAQESLRLLAADPGAARRRVVVAAEVPEGSVAPANDGEGADEAPGEVRVTGPLPLAKAAAVHLDAADAESEVAAAAEAFGAAEAGDEAAMSLLDRADDHELLWYAVQEIPHLTG